MAKKIYEGMSFDALCKKYLTEGADLAALSEEGSAPVEGEMDEFDAEMDAPVDEFGEDEVESEGDVTVTLSADLVAALRSILALVDSEESVEEEIGASEDVEPMEDEVDDYQDDVEMENDEQEGIYEEQEETVLGDGQGAQAAVVSASTSAPARKKGTPAVNRKGTGEGDFSKVTSRDGEAATSVGAPERKKGTPAVDRKATVAAAKAKPGKKVLDIQR
jgi:hypothetical protein